MDTPAQGEAWRLLLGVQVDATVIEICEAFEALVTTKLAPRDFEGTPFYAVSEPQLLDDQKLLLKHCAGCYVPRGYWMLRHVLPVDHGPGPVIVVRDLLSTERLGFGLSIAAAMIERKGAHASPSEFEGCIRDTLIAGLCCVLTHEACHAIDGLGEWREFAELIEGFGRIELVAARKFNELLELEEQQADPPPLVLECHGPRFARIVAHVDARLQSLGVRMDEPFDSHKYGNQPRFEVYREALKPELKQSAARSFSQILRRRPPAKFIKLTAH